MNFNLVIKEPVNLEILEAFEYYENLQTGLGKRLLDSIESALNSIKENPLGYQLKYKVYRTKSVKPFPYVLIFEVIKKDIIVYQFFCAKKDPQKKFKGKKK